MLFVFDNTKFCVYNHTKWQFAPSTLKQTTKTFPLEDFIIRIWNVFPCTSVTHPQKKILQLTLHIIYLSHSCALVLSVQHLFCELKSHKTKSMSVSHQSRKKTVIPLIVILRATSCYIFLLMCSQQSFLLQMTVVGVGRQKSHTCSAWSITHTSWWVHETIGAFRDLTRTLCWGSSAKREEPKC